MKTPRLALPGKKKPYVIGHRGSRACCPENTLLSFRHALQAGADLVETDLRLTRDGVVVCLHDATVDRTTNGTGRISQLSMEEAKALRVRNPDGSLSQESIPTLAEAAACLTPGTALALELKSNSFFERATCGRVAGILESAGAFDRSVVLSFSRRRLQAFAEEVPSLPAGLISLRGHTPEPGFHMLGPAWPVVFLNPWYVWVAHRRGQLVCPLDPKPDNRLWAYLLLRCDAVLTDDPAATRRRLGTWNRWQWA